MTLANQTHMNQIYYPISSCTNNIQDLSKCNTKMKYRDSGIPRTSPRTTFVWSCFNRIIAYSGSY